jgi:Raf kinase inhibitor-like YbhB/YbcL family protein
VSFTRPFWELSEGLTHPVAIMNLRGSFTLGSALFLVVGGCSFSADDTEESPAAAAGSSSGVGGSGGTPVSGAAGTSAVSGSPSMSGGGNASAGGASGSAGTGGSGGAAGGTGGAGGNAGSAGSAGSGGGGGSGGAPNTKLTITVDGVTMGDRLCFKPEASNSGGNHSPKIDWTGIPAGTQSLVLTMYDQSNTTPHRIVCNIPPTVMGQAADIKAVIPDGAQVSTGHSKPDNAWYGPGAGGNAHSYEIRIWALSTPTLEGGCTMSGAAPTRAVYDKLKNAPPTLVLASDFKVLWGNVNGMCTP